MDADTVELRVLGSLIEKQRTTPDAYPLSVNALRLACNQTTSRDPVVDYDEPTIRAAVERLSRRGWVRLTSGAGSRAAKYRHLFDEALEVSDAEISVLAVLVLRGPQTPGELKQRTERLHRFTSIGEVEDILDGLIARELVVHLERRPGQKEARYGHLLGGNVEPADPRAGTTEPVDRLAALEARVARVEQKLADLVEELGADDVDSAVWTEDSVATDSAEDTV
jgi:uncharacterized protein YceH (UPF0502 family)